MRTLQKGLALPTSWLSLALLCSTSSSGLANTSQPQSTNTADEALNLFNEYGAEWVFEPDNEALARQALSRGFEVYRLSVYSPARYRALHELYAHPDHSIAYNEYLKHTYASINFELAKGLSARPILRAALRSVDQIGATLDGLEPVLLFLLDAVGKEPGLTSTHWQETVDSLAATAGVLGIGSFSEATRDPLTVLFNFPSLVPFGFAGGNETFKVRPDFLHLATLNALDAVLAGYDLPSSSLESLLTQEAPDTCSELTSFDSISAQFPQLASALGSFSSDGELASSERAHNGSHGCSIPGAPNGSDQTGSNGGVFGAVSLGGGACTNTAVNAAHTLTSRAGFGPTTTTELLDTVATAMEECGPEFASARSDLPYYGPNSPQGNIADFDGFTEATGGSGENTLTIGDAMILAGEATGTVIVCSASAGGACFAGAVVLAGLLTNEIQEASEAGGSPSNGNEGSGSNSGDNGDDSNSGDDGDDSNNNNDNGDEGNNDNNKSDNSDNGDDDGNDGNDTPESPEENDSSNSGTPDDATMPSDPAGFECSSLAGDIVETVPPGDHEQLVIRPSDDGGVGSDQAPKCDSETSDQLTAGCGFAVHSGVESCVSVDCCPHRGPVDPQQMNSSCVSITCANGLPPVSENGLCGCVSVDGESSGFGPFDPNGGNFGPSIPNIPGEGGMNGF